MQKKKLNTIKNPGFKIPDDYFNSLEAAITHKIKTTQNTKVISIFSKKRLVYISGVAAAAILLLSLTFGKWNSTASNRLDVETIEDYMIIEDMVESYEMAILLEEEDLIEATFNQYNLDEDALETYLLNNLDIEDLIVE